MNNTNRLLNRLGILLVGLLLLGVGGAVAVAAVFPDTVAAWTTGAGIGGLVGGALRALAGAAAWLDDLLGTGSSGLLLAIAGLAALLSALLLWFITRQGRGHTSTLLTRTGDGTGIDAGAGSEVSAGVGGAVIVSSSLAASSIAHALRQYSGVTRVGVSAFRVRGATALKIAVSARRGVSPRDIRDHVDTIVQRFDELLGAEVPVFISITGGFASRRAHATRLVGPAHDQHRA